MAIKIAGCFNKKAKLWVKGRKGIFKNLKAAFDHNKKTAWFHCASLGEFEQARELLESFKEHFPDHNILLTFFSPSGYQTRKNYDKADNVFYLPIDTKRNAKKFISIVKPEIVFFIKYEYWFNYLSELKRKKIPVYIVSAIFRSDQHFFKCYGAWFRKQLKSITYFFVQNEESLQLLQSINLNNAMITGDTRFDRVYRIVQESKDFKLIEAFKNSDMIILGGSTWPEDENIIFDLHKSIPQIKLIVAPHEIHYSRIQKLKEKAGEESILFSEANEKNIKKSRILIINNIGMLSHLYKYSDLAYIGGGFGAGIHNILEAATWGKPIFFGPNYLKFREAHDLIEKGGAFSIKTSNEIIKITTEMINNSEKLSATGELCKSYVIQNKGATDKILKYVIKH